VKRNVNFTQTISFRCTDPDTLVELAETWDRLQAEGDVMGYMGSHILRDRDDPGHFVMLAEFGVIDPDVPAADEAMKNNEREETNLWARRLQEIVEGDIDWGHYDEIYRTG
jgi:hypothetical protein